MIMSTTNALGRMFVGLGSDLALAYVDRGPTPRNMYRNRIAQLTPDLGLIFLYIFTGEGTAWLTGAVALTAVGCDFKRRILITY